MGTAPGGGFERLRAPSRKLVVLRAGFAVVLGLLVFSTYQAWTIQNTLSRQTAEIYHRHTRQDDLLYRVRRTLWLGSSASRDYLLNPHGDRERHFGATLRGYRGESQELFAELERLTAPEPSPKALRLSIEEFWKTLEGIPRRTRGMTPAQQYAYVQQEIVPRRNGVGDLVREFAEVSRDAMAKSETDFAESRSNAGKRLLLIVGLTLVSGVLVSLYSLTHTEELARRTASQFREVEAARAELSQLSARLMEVQEEERTTLARELHDEIGQALATMRLETARAESGAAALPDVAGRLRRTGALIEKTIRGIRDISVLLRPSLLDDLGLAPALQWLVEDFARRTGVPCDYIDHDLHDTLPEAVRTCVYRVVQESLHNVEKHAEPRHVHVTLLQAGSGLTLVVEDDGKGFAVDEQGKPHGGAHFGILGMRERAVALGGTLDLQSAEGRGTRLELFLPLAGDAPALTHDATDEVRA